MIGKLSMICILCGVIAFTFLRVGDAKPSTFDEESMESVAKLMEKMISEKMRSKRSADVSYYLCLSTTSSQCDASCNGQCANKASFKKTFEQDGKCYQVLASGSCPEGDNTCSTGFRCDCDVAECD